MPVRGLESFPEEVSWVAGKRDNGSQGL